METIFAYLPKNLQEPLHDKRFLQMFEDIEEIRIRVDRPIEITANRTTHYVPYIVTMQDAEQLLEKLGNHSFYTLDEELKRGYITIRGGHRVGLAGRVILENGRVKGIRDVSSFNIRIAREKIGVADPFIPLLYDTRWHHTMIIGPPQSGKTTFLRDLARIISSGDKRRNIPPYKVGIVDERSEIAGCVKGVPQLTFGTRIDVLDACPKAEGMMMLIRSMSPDVLVVDEIGRKEDTEAILEAVHAGIRLIMTTHGETTEELKQRPTLRPIFEQNIFTRFIELSRKNSPVINVEIKNQRGQKILEKRVLRK